MREIFRAGPDDDGRRLDALVRKFLPDLGLGALQKALRAGDIRLNGAKAGPEARVASGDEVAVWDVLVRQGRREPPAPSAPPLPPAWILAETPDLLAVNKPSGVVVHRGDGPPGPGAEAPLDDRVRAYLAPEASGSLSFRPGPLHRLDRETSGLVVFSRTLEGARTFSAALAAREMTKTYLTVLAGRLEGPRKADAALARDSEARTSRRAEAGEEGSEALTWFRPLAWAPGLTLAEVDLGTGRTHQIRVHAAGLGFPLAGDAKYGGPPAPPGLPVPWLLHAWKLRAPGLGLDLEAPLAPAAASWVQKTFKI